MIQGLRRWTLRSGGFGNTMNILTEGLRRQVIQIERQGGRGVAPVDGWRRLRAVLASRALLAVARGPRQGPAPEGVGWAPMLSLAAALGVLLVVLAYTGARLVTPRTWWVEPIYWAGLLTLFAPAMARLLAVSASRRERIWLVAMLGLGLYSVKVLRSPLAFDAHDEFLHYRTVDDILRSGHLFGYNPLLPISARFPGAEIATGALVRVAGLSIFQAGIIIEAAARLTLVLALYLAYERASASSRLAGIASVVYMSNPKLLFFDAQFSYESLALPFASVVLVALVYRGHAPHAGRGRFGLTVVALLGLASLVVTHHLTSYAFVLFLLLWTAVYHTLSVRRRDVIRERMGPAGLTLLGAVLSLSWLVYVAPLVVEYLLPHLQGGVDELMGVITGRSTGRQLFRDHAGQEPPLWERLAQVASTVLILAGLPAGLYAVWRRYRTSPIALTLAGVALAYPLSLPFRLTEAGGEASDRAAGFVFVGVGFVLAIVMTGSWPFPAGSRKQIAILTALASLIFVGEAIVGLGPAWARLPGPYLVSADARSIEPQGLAAALWMRAHLGPDNRIATDRINGLLAGSYGEQYPVAHVNAGLDVAPVFFAPGFGPVQRGIIRQGKIHFLVVDHRLSTGLPLEGLYFDESEPDALQHKTPVSRVALTKFSRLIGVDQIYDGGDIVIYRIGTAAREP